MTGLAGLRIALVGPLPPPSGGMANQTRQLAVLLRGAQAEVCLVQSNARCRPAWAERIPVVRAVFRLLPFVHALWRAAGGSDLLHVMANSGWSWHLFAAPAIWIGRLRQVPVVVNYRGGEAAEFLARSGRLVRYSMLRAASLVVPSGFLVEVFARHGLPAQIVPNVVDLGRFHAGTGAPLAAPRIVVARNLEPIYDNETALRAFAIVLERLPAARLTIAGTGPEQPRLHTLAGALGIQANVTFSGRLERDAMASMLRECSVALNPSRVDNTPNSVLEALASGVPVVSTRVGGVPHIVEDGVTALLVPPQDPVAMAAAVLRVLGDPALARSLAQAGLRAVKAFEWGAVAPTLADVYRHALRAGA